MVVLQSLIGRVTGLVAQLVGLGIFAAVLAAAAAVVHRWYVREGIARALALLVGLSGVAVYLNTTTALGTVIAGSSAPTETQVALFNISAFIVGAGGALLGRTVGDRFGTDVLLGEGFADMEADVGRLVQSVGRVVVVELPTEIDDTVGYDPVAAETKEELAGKRFVFPRRLTIGELRERLVTRLKADYGVGHVDVELDDDGTVEYLALGSRAAGIGPTLPPATNAVVIRADPAFAASAGDLVQVWETDPMRRVLTAELRGVSEDTVTIAIDAADTQKVDPTREYRLVTLPVEDRPDREFASLLRAAEETFSSVTVEAGSPLHGMPVGALDFTVVALKPEGEQPRAIPDRTTVLAPGDVVFAIARPEHLRRLEAAARPLDPSLVSSPAPQQSPQPATGDTTADDASDSDQTTDQSGDDQPSPAQEPAADPTADETEMPDETEVPPAEAATGAETPEDDAEPESAPLAGDSDGTDSEGSATPDPDDTDDAEPASAAADDGEDADDGQSGGVGSSSFQQLKAEFESGDADWAEEDERPPSEDESATADATADADSEGAAFEGNGVDTLDVGDEDTGDGPDELDSDEDIDGLALEDDTETGSDTVETDSGGLDSGVGLEDASFGDEDDSEPEADSDDGLAGLDFDDDDDDGLDELSFDDDEDDGGDDLSSLSFDDDDTEEGFSLDEDDDAEGETGEKSDGDSDDDAEDKSNSDDDEDDDGGGGGGAASFQQLKEEFESGDADWEDDISDSPGGDMRLDE